MIKCAGGNAQCRSVFNYDKKRETILYAHENERMKPGFHEPQLPIERSVTLVSSIVVERRCCAIQVSSVARLQENKQR